jgi:hypothetical protein
MRDESPEVNKRKKKENNKQLRENSVQEEECDMRKLRINEWKTKKTQTATCRRGHKIIF